MFGCGWCRSWIETPKVRVDAFISPGLPHIVTGPIAHLSLTMATFQVALDALKKAALDDKTTPREVKDTVDRVSSSLTPLRVGLQLFF